MGRISRDYLIWLSLSVWLASQGKALIFSKYGTCVQPWGKWEMECVSFICLMLCNPPSTLCWLFSAECLLLKGPLLARTNPMPGEVNGNLSLDLRVL